MLCSDTAAVDDEQTEFSLLPMRGK